MEAKKIVVVGAGPAGGFSAYLLAKAGFEVSVFEEHVVVGEPVACTGVITGDVMAQRLKLPKELIVNRIAKARIIAPNKEHVEVRLKNDIIIDRAGFDRHISDMAKEAGAKFYANHRFETLEYGSSNSGEKNGKKRIIAAVKDKANGETKKIEADYLIGADGPISSVAKAAGLYGNRQFYSGIQVTIPVENDNVIDFYPGKEGIAWVVPENNGVARVGIAARREANSYFRRFITAVAGEGYEKKIIGWQAGPIPLYDPRLKSATKDGRILLVGDAATMVKAPTLGGINQSLIAAEAAAAAIIEKKDYEKLWKGKMGKDLYLSLLMRKAMEKFSDNDYNELVETFTKEKNKSILESYDRDVPTKFALKLLMREPKLLLLAKKAWF
ncbi:NAD(P)/FAD-dependent oxidoreductase [Candidatus Woesearchaeota archaeon]|nr:NAD(P)/FAD-dependent oxidoreductase [Candidatus Woesearchaeota archaeon]